MLAGDEDAEATRTSTATTHHCEGPASCRTMKSMIGTRHPRPSPRPRTNKDPPFAIGRKPVHRSRRRIRSSFAAPVATFKTLHPVGRTQIFPTGYAPSFLSPLLLVAVGRFFACHVPQLVGKMSSSRISSSSKEDVRQVEMREDTFVYVEGSDEEKALLRKM